MKVDGGEVRQRFHPFPCFSRSLVALPVAPWCRSYCRGYWLTVRRLISLGLALSSTLPPPVLLLGVKHWQFTKGAIEGQQVRLKLLRMDQVRANLITEINPNSEREHIGDHVENT